MVSQAVQWYLLVGALLISISLMRPLLARSWVSPVHLQLLAGMLAGPWCLDLIQLSMVGDSNLLEVASEIAVIISLYAAGIKMRIPLLSRRWMAPLVLASVTMVATIALTAIVGVYLLGLSWPAALLLGAVLAPTDPVLADRVQVEHAGDDDRLRQGLTGEAGLNDGTAFPFVLLAIGLISPELHQLGPGLSTWLWFDVAWKIIGGVLFGAMAGYLLGKVAPWWKSPDERPGPSEELLTMGSIALVYGFALAIDAYAFLAVFAAAVSLRRIEMHASQTEDKCNTSSRNKNSQNEREEESAPAVLVRQQSEVGASLERVAQVMLVVVIGVLLSSASLWSRQYWSFALLMVVLVRPISVLATLHVRSLDSPQRFLIAWFGVRGIGTVYYLSHAITHGVGPALTWQLDAIINACIVTITLSILVHGTSDTPLMAWYQKRQPG